MSSLDPPWFSDKDKILSNKGGTVLLIFSSLSQHSQT